VTHRPCFATPAPLGKATTDFTARTLTNYEAFGERLVRSIKEECLDNGAFRPSLELEFSKKGGGVSPPR
jgi:hypothetical protein